MLCIRHSLSIGAFLPATLLCICANSHLANDLAMSPALDRRSGQTPFVLSLPFSYTGPALGMIQQWFLLLGWQMKARLALKLADRSSGTHASRLWRTCWRRQVSRHQDCKILNPKTLLCCLVWSPRYAQQIGIGACSQWFPLIGWQMKHVGRSSKLYTFRLWRLAAEDRSVELYSLSNVVPVLVLIYIVNV